MLAQAQIHANTLPSRVANFLHQFSADASIKELVFSTMTGISLQDSWWRKCTHWCRTFPQALTTVLLIQSIRTVIVTITDPGLLNTIPTMALEHWATWTASCRVLIMLSQFMNILAKNYAFPSHLELKLNRCSMILLQQKARWPTYKAFSLPNDPSLQSTPLLR